MKKIAILSSGGSETTSRLIKIFNSGSRLRVDLVVTDRENSGLQESLTGSGVEVIFLPREVWHGDGLELLGLLRGHDVDIVAKDELKGVVPLSVEEAYSGNIIELSGPEEAPRQLISLLQSTPTPPPVPKSVDEEWAETLQVKFDPAEVRQRQTPPPVPEQQPYFLRQAPIGASQTRPAEPMPSTFLIWAVLATVFCCFIPGVVAIIFASQVSSRYASGDVEGSRRASRNAEIWIIVSIVLGVISAGLYLPMMLL